MPNTFKEKDGSLKVKNKVEIFFAGNNKDDLTVIITQLRQVLFSSLIRTTILIPSLN